MNKLSELMSKKTYKNMVERLKKGRSSDSIYSLIMIALEFHDAIENISCQPAPEYADITDRNIMRKYGIELGMGDIIEVELKGSTTSIYSPCINVTNTVFLVYPKLNCVIQVTKEKEIDIEDITESRNMFNSTSKCTYVGSMAICDFFEYLSTLPNSLLFVVPDLLPFDTKKEFVIGLDLLKLMPKFTLDFGEESAVSDALVGVFGVNLTNEQSSELLSFIRCVGEFNETDIEKFINEKLTKKVFFPYGNEALRLSQIICFRLIIEGKISEVKKGSYLFKK